MGCLITFEIVRSFMVLSARMKYRQKKLNHSYQRILAILLPGMLFFNGCVFNSAVQLDPKFPIVETIPLLPPSIPIIHPTITFLSMTPIYSLSLDPSGRYLAAGSSKTILIWDSTSQADPRILPSGNNDVLSVAFSPDGRLLAAGNYITIELLDFPSGKHVTTLFGHNNYVESLAFSSDGLLLVSGSRGRNPSIRVWDVPNKKLSKTLTHPLERAETVRDLAISPDSHWVASIGLDRAVQLWNLSRRRMTPGNKLLEAGATPLQVAFSPDQKILATGTAEGNLVLYQWLGNEPPRIIQAHQGRILSLTFSPDSQRLISIGRDRTVRQWEVETGLAIGIWGLDFEVRFAKVTSDGTHVAVGGSRAVAFFSIEN